MNEGDFTIIIPSKIIDTNLIDCEKAIRKFYLNIKIILLIDYNNLNHLFSKNTEVILTGSVNISEKRNIGFDNCSTKYIVMIDSDAYPFSPWLDEIENIFLSNKNIGAVGGPNISPNTNNIYKKIISEIKKSFFVTFQNKILKKDNKISKQTNFLPSCNLILKKSIFQKGKFMNKDLFAHEDLALNEYIKKRGYLIYYDYRVSVFHKDRLPNSFIRQRFTYGSESLKIFLLYPSFFSFLLIASTFPFIYFIFFSIMIFTKYFVISHNYLDYFINFSIFLFFIIFTLILYETSRIYKKINKYFIKILLYITCSIFMPGLGLVLKPFLKFKTRKKIWIQ